MKILFITHPYPNYVPDILLHGLRKLMGQDIIDYPKKDCLYKGVLGLGVCPDDQLCPNWFPSDNGQIDRENIFEKIKKDFFKYIICDVRAVSILQKNLNHLPSGLILIDGEDAPAKIAPGSYLISRRETDGSDFSIPLPMAIPEEIFDWVSSYDNVQKKYNIGFMGCASDENRKTVVMTLNQHYENNLFQTSAIPSTSSPLPEGRLGRDDYYRSLQECRIVLSLPGTGNDTFRFWENVACASIHMASEMPLYIPNNFIDKKHIFRFATIGELRKNIDSVLEEKVKNEEILLEERKHLLDFHLSTKRAKYFLDKAEGAFTK